MTGDLPDTLKALLTESLPALFEGPAGGPVGLSVVGGPLLIDQEQTADATASEPRPDGRVDELAFDPDSPAGPYTLSQPPYPGPRRVWLVSGAGARIPLRAEEVVWDRADTRNFSLALRPQRDASAVTGVRVLYGVTAIYTCVKAAQTLEVHLNTSDAGTLERAEALVVAVLQLNRQRLLDEARTNYEDGEYEARIEVKNLSVASGTRPTGESRLLTLQAEVELRAGRALREDEGVPIEHILTPGRPADPSRPVDVHVDGEA